MSVSLNSKDYQIESIQLNQSNPNSTLPSLTNIDTITSDMSSSIPRNGIKIDRDRVLAYEAYRKKNSLKNINNNKGSHLEKTRD